MAPFPYDQIFCICTGNQCSAPALSQTKNNVCYGMSGESPVDHIINAGVQAPTVRGQWSATATGGFVHDNTYINYYAGGRHGAWSDIGNAFNNDDQYALYSPPFTQEDWIVDSDGTQHVNGATFPLTPPGPIPPLVDLGDYLVLTGFGFGIPSDATIVGISGAVRARVDISNGNGGVVGSFQRGTPGVGNIALYSGGNFYYTQDPSSRANSDIDGLGSSSSDSGVRYSQYPYPTDLPSSVCQCFTQGAFANGGGLHSSNAPFPDDFMPQGGITYLGAGVVQPTHSALLGAYSCDAASGPTMTKTFQISTTRQSWTPEEVNDSNFGIAFNIYSDQFWAATLINNSGSTVNVGLVSAPAHSSNFATRTPLYRVFSVGLVVYYTGGGTATGSANICLPCPSCSESPCGDEFVPTGNPYVTGCEG